MLECRQTFTIANNMALSALRENIILMKNSVCLDQDNLIKLSCTDERSVCPAYVKMCSGCGKTHNLVQGTPICIHMKPSMVSNNFGKYNIYPETQQIHFVCHGESLSGL